MRFLPILLLIASQALAWSPGRIYLPDASPTQHRGVHFLQAIQRCNGVALNVTFRGDNGTPTVLQGGITFEGMF